MTLNEILKKNPEWLFTVLMGHSIMLVMVLMVLECVISHMMIGKMKMFWSFQQTRKG